ncbi:hypothetical protein AXT83_004727 [Salmonella enterica subsp. enterica]|nr:hypothetical protein [Salmonella enterica]EBX0637914.1 hypothetical protein [Salmonella enterica subsp. enterica serovar Schwarzengrund]EDT4908922.1 hypothetical protein [Salmonella enterica subsp. enterica]EAQ3582047.1 hypothetical protein [Salmonella enterica]EAU1940165.1 hypothetical protein [Salmonella enterica]
MLVRGAEPMEKRHRRILFLFSPTSDPSLSPLLCEQVTPAAVSRQERSDRVSEEASFHPFLYFLPTHFCCISPCHMTHFPESPTRTNIGSQYTLR